MFTTGEKRLLLLYYSGSVSETAAVLYDALRDTYEPYERVLILNVIRKLESVSEKAFEVYIEESGVLL